MIRIYDTELSSARSYTDARLVFHPVMHRNAADVSHHALCAVLLGFSSRLRMAGP